MQSAAERQDCAAVKAQTRFSERRSTPGPALAVELLADLALYLGIVVARVRFCTGRAALLERRARGQPPLPQPTGKASPVGPTLC
jgi:hypothetical protein